MNRCDAADGAEEESFSAVAFPLTTAFFLPGRFLKTEDKSSVRSPAAALVRPGRLRMYSAPPSPRSRKAWSEKMMQPGGSAGAPSLH